MTAAGVFNLKEGTIYPILSRLAKDGLVQTEWVESNQGPPRKYYSLTESGRTICEVLKNEFRRLVNVVEASGQEDNPDPENETDKKTIIPRQNHE
jgi:PadR family transcriptional regulator PadR